MPEDPTLPPSAPDPDATLPAAPAGEEVSLERFGEYELLRKLAQGGMGVVFRARQASLGRDVALKMILSGQFATESDVARFRLEAEAAATLDHPGIVPIYEIGERDGRHYFTMKLVEGGSLADLVPRLVNDPKEAARLVALVARAVHYAHQRGILHRDLKPANVLIDRDGAPVVTDFGLARRTASDAGLTQTGAIVGTPAYMPPEQASGRKDLTVAVDVYSLGAILYECLTSKPPFRGDTALDTIMQVLEREPQRPREICPHLDADLEAVALKCLEKEPRRRFESAEALADDLDRYAQGEPVRARPASALARGWRWAWKQPVLMAAVAGGMMTVGMLTTFLIAIPGLGSLVGVAAAVAFGALFFGVAYVGQRERGRLVRRMDSLAAEFAARPAAPHAVAPPSVAVYSRREVILGMGSAALLGATLAAAGVFGLWLHLGWPAWSPWLLAVPAQGATLGAALGAVAEVAGGRRVGGRAAILGGVALALVAALSHNDWGAVPAGKMPRGYLVAIGLMLLAPLGLAVNFWIARRSLDRQGPGQAEAHFAILSQSYERLLHALSAGGIAAVGAMLCGSLVGFEAGFRLGGSLGAAVGLTLGGAGLVLLCGTLGWLRKPTMERLDLRAGSVLGVAGFAALMWMSFGGSGSGDDLGSAPADAHAVAWVGDRVWAVDSRGEAKGYLPPALTETQRLPSDHPLAAVPGARPFGVAAGGRRAFLLRANAVQILKPDAAGQLVVAKTVTVGRAYRVAANGDLTRLLVFDQPNLDVWDVEKGKRYARSFAGFGVVRALAWSRSGSNALIGFDDGERWLVWTGQSEARKKLAQLGPVPDVVRLPPARGAVRAAAFTPDGKFAITAGADWTIRVWEAATGTPVGTLHGHRAGVNDVAVSEDGSRLVSASDDRTIRVWDLPERRLVATLRGHTGSVNSVALASDGRIVSAGDDRTIRLWRMP